MFLEKFNQMRLKRQAEVRNKIFFYSLLAGLISSFATLFLSKKENRNKIAKKAREFQKSASTRLNEAAKVLNEESTKIEQNLEEKATEAKKGATNFLERFRKSQTTEVVETKKPSRPRSRSRSKKPGASSTTK